MCDKVKSSHSHNVHRIVYFEPFAPAALFLRILFAMALSKEKKQKEVDVYRIIVTGGLCLVVCCCIGFPAVFYTDPLMSPVLL